MGRIYFILSLVALLVVLPLLSQAQGIQLRNPLEYDTIEDLIDAILVFLQNLALVVTALVIVVAGYMFVTSMGDPQKVTQARWMVIYALIGLAIILVARGIIALIKRVIGVE